VLQASIRPDASELESRRRIRRQDALDDTRRGTRSAPASTHCRGSLHPRLARAHRTLPTDSHSDSRSQGWVNAERCACAVSPATVAVSCSSRRTGSPSPPWLPTSASARSQFSSGVPASSPCEISCARRRTASASSGLCSSSGDGTANGRSSGSSAGAPRRLAAHGPTRASATSSSRSSRRSARSPSASATRRSTRPPRRRRSSSSPARLAEPRGFRGSRTRRGRGTGSRSTSRSTSSMTRKAVGRHDR
jgi:hypothetical protein